MKYTVKDLRVDFPDEDACLEWLINFQFPNGVFCVECDKVTKHYKIKGRKVYSCSKCGHHISPTAGTIFHKSSTPLTDWFHAIWLMSTNKAGTSAKEIERELGVSYPTAWRMMHKIREMMSAPDELFSDEVEVDETFVLPNTFKRSTARLRFGNDARRKGETIVGIVQRGGHVRVWHVESASAKILQTLIRENIKFGSLVFTDGYNAYRKLPKMGFYHNWTDHGRGQHVDGENHTQNIENVWSHFKRGIKGVYRHIGIKYIQAYANEYAWRYSHRNDVSMFWSLMSRIDED